jgi:hypothetical protein
MNEKKSPWFDLCLAMLAGFAGVIALAAVCHALGLVSHRHMGAGYPYTNYLSACLNLGSIIAYFLLAALLGTASKRGWPIALGMMLPWPIACAIEIEIDPTSHNLFPFEAVISWLPAFLFALLGAYAGRKIISRFGKDTLAESGKTDGA